MSKNNKNKIKFEEQFPTLDGKIIFLQSFDLINLQKAAKIGNISGSKLKNKDEAIKSILSFDLKNKFIICRNIFSNYEEYSKHKVNDNEILRTIEFNAYKARKMKNSKFKKMKKIKNELTNELEIANWQNNIDDTLDINYESNFKSSDLEDNRNNHTLEKTIKKILMDSNFRNRITKTFNFNSSRKNWLSRLDKELKREQEEHKMRMNNIWESSNKRQEHLQERYLKIIAEELNYMNMVMSELIKLNTYNRKLHSKYNLLTEENLFETTKINLNSKNNMEKNIRTIATTISLKIPKKEY
ncbi:MAG: hypothetical protein HDR43_02150 [Mycoplasma sp.]|nr:hypothetical protein [Mycoplasma sp.]